MGDQKGGGGSITGCGQSGRRRREFGRIREGGRGSVTESGWSEGRKRVSECGQSGVSVAEYGQLREIVADLEDLEKSV